MESYLLGWAELLLRWVHVITAIAWIGASFYFVFLDASLIAPVDEDLKKQGVSGELWAVHGGGFYHPLKFALKPPQLPAHLHWFYWEAYSTWLSGFALFSVSYLWHAGTYLVDKSLASWSPAVAAAVALSFFVIFLLFFGCYTTEFAGWGAGAKMAMRSSACWSACWSAPPPGWPAAGLRGELPF